MWRMIAPVMAVSILLMVVGMGAAWSGYHVNVTVSDALVHQVQASIASEELVVALRTSQSEIDQYSAKADHIHLELALAQREPVRRALKGLQESLAPLGGPLPAQIDQAQAKFFNNLQGVAAASTASPRQIAELTTELEERVLLPAQQLRKEYRDVIGGQSRQNLVLAYRIGTGILVLGACGAFAGLLAGYAIARGVTRSIEQLGQSMRDMADTLDASEGEGQYAGADLPGLNDKMQRLTSKGATMMRELHETRQHIERSGQLAAVGQLAAGLAHELRNPLTSIKLLVQSAEERNTGLEGRELQVLDEEVVRLERLLQTFLDLARPPKPKKQHVILNELVQETVDFVRRRGEQQGVHIEYTGPQVEHQLLGDRQQLRQVLLNLLLNAIDAQPRGGQVRVGLEPQQLNGKPEFLIRISDEGPGLPVELGDRIFEPFVTTKETGIGIGLTLSRRIVESHGGSLEAESLRPSGAEFRMLLPAGE